MTAGAEVKPRRGRLQPHQGHRPAGAEEAGRAVHGPSTAGSQPLWLETTAEDPGVGMCRAGRRRGLRRRLRLRRRRHRDGRGHRAGRVRRTAGDPAGRHRQPAGPQPRPAAQRRGRPACASASTGRDPARSTSAAVEDRKFVVMAGLGFDAAMMRDAPGGAEEDGRLAGVRRVGDQAPARPRHPRDAHRSTTASRCTGGSRTVVVGNVGKLQGNIPLLPDAKPDDGVLDVVVIAIRNVLDWVAGRRAGDAPRRRAGPADGAVHGQARPDRGQPHPAAPARRRRHRGQPDDGHPHRARRPASCGSAS